MKQTFDLYENVKDDMKFFINSDVRSKIVLSLMGGSKNLSYLRKELNFSSSTILHAIYLLEDKKLVLKDSGQYYLSQTGELFALKLLSLMKSFSSWNKMECLFLNHEIQVIPSELLEEIGYLEDAYILESDTQNLIGPYDIISKKIQSSKTVNFVSSVYYPFYMDILKKSDITGNIIVTRDILDIIFNESSNQDLNRSNISLWEIGDNLKLSLALADEFMAMGLFLDNGVYDSDRFLISEGHGALNWGKRLFNYYLKQAREFEW
ncbi:helix-turn-helix transcriptional regulator [Methanobacterium alcaliphilum]|uniref:helix-turn-helix transcriptional regulator n=1 Tax=Methanobacterium alcaliphilum TaxID=392018 RepID=UPI00200B3272|nr:transcriptional regulator FilR1 domain-containing protein [Methanobacterium alcaliphilum]MCK9151929.1 DUF1724 domain-containing protein [Methanobacterium alcaliphilum]